MTANSRKTSGLGSTRSRPALSRCVGDNTEAFAESYWGKRPLLSPAVSEYRDLFCAEAVDELLSHRGIRAPFMRMAKEGNVLPDARFTGPTGAGAMVADQVISDTAFSEFADGASIVLQAVHRTWDPVARFSDALAHEMGHPNQVNAYVTPPQSQGFSAHYDTHDVFVLQIHGEKHWRIHAPVLEAPLPSQPWQQVKAQVAAASQEQPVIDAVLRPGDALYLPRGWIHSASALGEVSIHLTVGIHALTEHDVVCALVARAAEDERLRRNLPLGVGSAGASVGGGLAGVLLQPEIKAVAKALTDVINAVTPEQVADDLASTLLQGTRAQPIEPLAQLRAAQDLSASDLIKLRQGIGFRIAKHPTDPSKVRVFGARLVLTLPDSCADAVHRIGEGSAVQVGDLPGLDSADALTLTRRLLREAIVVPVR